MERDEVVLCDVGALTRTLPVTGKTKETYETIIKEENRLTNKCYADFSTVEQKTVLGLIQKTRKNNEDDWYEFERYK